jgi:carbamate kinase
LLAQRLVADVLLLLTDVSALERDWDKPHARPTARATTTQLRHLTFAPGSVGPKVEAACRFVEATNGTAAIGSVDDAARILRREAGTTVVQA